MNYLCLECTTDFIGECIAAGHSLVGVEYVADSTETKCDRCGAALPESPEKESFARLLLTRTLTVMRDRQARSILILEGKA